MVGGIRGWGFNAAADKVDGAVGDEGVVACCAGDGAAIGNGGAGRSEVVLGSGDDMERGLAGSSGRGDGAGVGWVAMSAAGGGVARAWSGRGGSSSSLLIRSRNGACSHMAVCRHFWMLWPGCEQKRHRLECNWEWGSGFCMVRWNGRGCSSWDSDTGRSGVAVGVGILQGQWQCEQVWWEMRGNVGNLGKAMNAARAGNLGNVGEADNVRR